MRAERLIHASAFRSDPRRGLLPAPNPFVAGCALLQQVHSGADDVDLGVDAKASFQAFDAAIIGLLNHQRFAHTFEYITKYT